jgi:hypothetical protein
LRARWSALFTAATVVSSDSDTSRAEKPSTSRRMSAARCVAGKDVAKKANEIAPGRLRCSVWH